MPRCSLAADDVLPTPADDIRAQNPHPLLCSTAALGKTKRNRRNAQGRWRNVERNKQKKNREAETDTEDTGWARRWCSLARVYKDRLSELLLQSFALGLPVRESKETNTRHCLVQRRILRNRILTYTFVSWTLAIISSSTGITLEARLVWYSAYSLPFYIEYRAAIH